MGKLVRDKIPEIIRENGENPTVRKLVGQELGRALLNKLIEKARMDKAEARGVFEERLYLEGAEDE